MSTMLIEYTKLHIISLQQDREMATEESMYHYYDGGIEACEHLLSVMEEYNG